MKVATNNNKTGKGRITPPIALERAESHSLVKGEYLAYKLRNDPADESSPTYELSVPYFSTGTCEEWLKFRDNVEKVLLGQHVTTGPAKFTMARRLLIGDALSVFNSALLELGVNETNQSYELCMDALGRHVFPKRASQLQKRYMRRFIRKPADMTTKTFAARLQELNTYLPKFPTAAPGLASVNKLDDDEIVNIMEFVMPRQWQHKMMKHDFDVMTASIHDFIDFCDRMESIAADGGPTPEKSTQNQDNNKKNAKAQKKRPRGDPEKGNFCLVHGPTGPNGHTSNDCKVLMAQAKKIRASYEEGDGKRVRIGKKGEELNLTVDEHGTVRFGPKKSDQAAAQAAKNKVKKRKPSAQFEKDLQNMEALTLSSDASSTSSTASDSS